MSKTHKTLTLLAAAAGSLGLAGPASAATTYTVSLQADVTDGNCSAAVGDCSLREAITAANGSGDTATIQLTQAGTYKVNSTLALNTNGANRITIVGKSPAQTSIAAADGVTARILTISGTRPVSLKQLTVSGGKAQDGAGAGVSANADLTTDLVRFTGNAATRYGGGVGVDGGVITANRTTFDNNSAPDGGSGLAVFGGTVSKLSNSTVAKNTGAQAALYAARDANSVTGDVELFQSTVAGNVNTDTGAVSGMYAGRESSFTLSRTIVDQGNTGCDTFDDNPATPNDDESGTIFDSGNNLDSGNTCYVAGATSRISTPAGLQTELRYGFGTGGPPVLAPAPGSAAIDTAANAGCDAQDAREFGANRPIDGNGDGTSACDVGAVEYEPASREFVASSTTPTAAAVAVDVSNGDAPSTVRVQFGTTPAYGAETAPVAVAYVADVQRADVGIGGLAPNTEYHFRVVGSDGSGNFYGPDRTFKTKAAPVVVQPPAQQPTTPPALTTRVGKLGRFSLKKVLKKGYSFTVQCSAVCVNKATLSIPKKAAKRLKIKTTLGSKTASSNAAGKATVKLKVSKKVAKKLRSKKGRKLVKKATLTIVSQAAADGVKPVTTKKSVTLKP